MFLKGNKRIEQYFRKKDVSSTIFLMFTAFDKGDMFFSSFCLVYHQTINSNLSFSPLFCNKYLNNIEEIPFLTRKLLGIPILQIVLIVLPWGIMKEKQQMFLSWLSSLWPKVSLWCCLEIVNRYLTTYLKSLSDAVPGYWKEQLHHPFTSWLALFLVFLNWGSTTHWIVNWPGLI